MTKAQLKILYSMLFVLSFCSNIMIPLTGFLFLDQKGFLPDASNYLKYNAYSFSIGIYFFGTLVGSYFWGMISDIINNKKALFSCLLLSLCSYLIGLLSLVFLNPMYFFIFRLVDGLMYGRRVIILSILMHSGGIKKNIFKTVEIIETIGLLIAPLLGGLLIQFKTPVPLYYYSTPLLVIIILTIFNLLLLRNLNQLDYKSTKLNASQTQKPTYNKSLFIEYFILRSSWYLYYISILPFFVTIYGLNSIKIGFIYSGVVFSYIFFLNFNNQIILNKVRPMLAKKVALTILTLSFLLLTFFSRNVVGFILCNIGIVGSIALLNPLYSASISESVSDEHQGKLLGVLITVNAISSIIISSLLGTLNSLSIYAPYLFAAGILTVSQWITRCNTKHTP